MVNIHRRNQNNIGDMWSTPLRYFPQLAQGAITIDVRGPLQGGATPPDYFSSVGGSALIVGGGGLLGYPLFDHNIPIALSAHPRLRVAWGVGTNSHNGVASERYPSYLSSFDLVGIRDKPSTHDFTWVPCASAMHPLLPKLKSTSPEHDVVVFTHSVHRNAEVAAALPQRDFPHLSNDESSVASTMGFLASGDTVLTNSYHGAYWATLLGRKVVIVAPFSSKFGTLPWDTPIVDNPSNWRDGADVTHPHDGALDTARSANLEFAERVYDRALGQTFEVAKLDADVLLREFNKE